jgi:hypothetical protein
MQSDLSALEDLRAALQGLGDALAAGRIDEVLASEPRVTGALTLLQTIHPSGIPLSDVDRGRLREAAAGSQVALRRCQRLGGSLADVVRCVLVAQGRAGTYGREGRETFESRGGALTARG